MQWKQSYGKISYTKYYIILLTLICFALNSHILFLNGYRGSDGKIICYKTSANKHYIYPEWEHVHLVLYNLCPFAIMCICNTYIIFVTVRSSRTQAVPTQRRTYQRNLEKYRHLTALLIIATFTFVLLTLPAGIYFAMFRSNLNSTEEHMVSYRFKIQILLTSIQFTSHGINFFLYCFSASSFRHQLSAMLRELITYCHCTCRCPCNNIRKNHHQRYSRSSSSFEHQPVNGACEIEINY